MDEILLNIIKAVVTTVVIPLIVFLGTKLNTYLKTKIENEKIQKHLTAANDAIVIATTSTLQTYVDELKKQDKFDKEAQLIALEKAKEKALTLIKEETKDVIKNIYGDFDEWLLNIIETKVKEIK